MASKPIKLSGPWDDGYAIDYHIVRSEFTGYDERGHAMFDTERTELGELLYQLKYRGDTTALSKIVGVACDFIAGWKIKPDCVIPVPPSRKGRRVQPVVEIARGIAANLKIGLCEKSVVKVKETPELKNITDYEERVNQLNGAYDIGDASLNGKTVLVVDDLYRSGATLNALAEALHRKGKVKKSYVLALTRTRSGS
jgi:predicted amidophosphoribosyltransferase